ncbi:MAG: thiolase domain-containing protein [Thermoprotei archaeon]|nr:thiolase domain-containing protein [Thermoprotei archaeon]
MYGVRLLRVAIVGVGWYGFKPSAPELSFREMMFEAAVRAYRDANIDPRRDVDAFISCQEDFWEGIAISDEFATEPIGGVLRPTMTIAGDGLQCVGQAYAMVKTGAFETIVVEAHAKPSDILSIQEIYELALDPQLRVLEVKNPLFQAGLDAVAYMRRSGARREHLALVAYKNKNRGLLNPRASHAAPVRLEDIMESETVIYPMGRHEIAGFTDVAINMVIASESKAKSYTDKPVWIEGVGWATELGSGVVEWHSWGRMPSMRTAGLMAYKQAGIENPLKQADFAEVEDRFSYMELLALEELGLGGVEGVPKLLESGYYHPKGGLPVNPSGGSLSLGVTLEATGLSRLLEAALQLRGEAGGVQLKGVKRAIVASWRGPPTYTSMVVVVSSS